MVIILSDRTIFQKTQRNYKRKMASSKTLVYYFVPEDGDIPSEPNAFPIPKSPVTLGDLRAYFPMPGEYQFRSKYLYNGSQVWLDLTDDAATVPEF